MAAYIAIPLIDEALICRVVIETQPANSSVCLTGYERVNIIIQHEISY